MNHLTPHFCFFQRNKIYLNSILFALIGLVYCSAGLAPVKRYLSIESETEFNKRRLISVEVTTSAYAFVRILDFETNSTEWTHISLTGLSGSAVTNYGRPVSVTLDLEERTALVEIGGDKISVRQNTARVVNYSGILSGVIPGSPSATSALGFLDIIDGAFCVWHWSDNTGRPGGAFGVKVDDIWTSFIVDSSIVIESTINFEGSIVEGYAEFVADGSHAFRFVLSETITASMVNISTRGWIGEGKNMIAGTVVSRESMTILIRAVGPTLAGFGLETAHPDPRIELFEGPVSIVSNDDWSGQRVIDATAKVGGFALPNGSKDAGLLITVDPGAYTIIVSGDGELREAIVEVYQVE